MIRLLKSKGYKFTKKDTLNNREFRELSTAFVINEDLSTFDDRVYDVSTTIELFLEERLYSEKRVNAIVDETRAGDIHEITVDIERSERGRMVTFVTTKIGVK
jgi:hypothetical protein